MTSPSRPASCSGLRISVTAAPRRSSVATCSRKFPWRARTPMRSCSGTPRLYGALQRPLEGGAVLRGAALVADAEPLLALRGGAVRPALRVDAALSALLNTVVADCGGGVEAI